MMLHFSKEEKVAGKQQKKLRKNDISVPASPQPVLLRSSRHNLQSSSSNQGATYTKGKNTYRKTDLVRNLNQVIGINASKSAVPFCIGEELSPKSCSSARNTALEVQASVNCSEIDDLKRRLQDANLQIAEVVAQSVILVRDMQCAASKEIADVMRHVHPSSGMGAGTSEQELASTRQELADCKNMLADMRRQLEQTSFEKEKLEMYLRSSVQTSRKLQDTLVNQRSVMQLELLAAEDRCRNEVAVLVHSARIEAKHLQEQLDAALLSKADADFSLRDCIRLLCQTQRELLTWNAPAKQQCCFQLAVQDNLQQLQNARAQVKVERENLDEAFSQNAINWTVLECVWEGAVRSILKSGGSSVAEHNLHVETPGSFTKNLKKLDPQAQKCSCSLQEELTPLKSWSSLATPRSPIFREDGQRRPRSEIFSWEDVLRENLIKSEHEVEILGDKVDELRIILEKVTSLLDCISKCSVTGHETKILMRRIIQQLQTFEIHPDAHELTPEDETTKETNHIFN